MSEKEKYGEIRDGSDLEVFMRRALSPLKLIAEYGISLPSGISYANEGTEKRLLDYTHDIIIDFLDKWEYAQSKMFEIYAKKHAK